MACFDLQHQYLVQPLFVDSSLAASRYSIAATQVLCCTYCVHKSRPKVSFVKVFFFSFCFLDTIRSFAFCGRGLNRPKCIAVHYWGMFWDLVLPNSTDRVVWKIICAWLILFCIWSYSEAGASWWWLATQLLTLWSHAQSRNSCSHYVFLHSGWFPLDIFLVS